MTEVGPDPDQRSSPPKAVTGTPPPGTSVPGTSVPGTSVPMWRTTVISMTSTVVVAVPQMLIGALSVLIQTDIAFDESMLGMGISLYFLVAGIGSIVGGRLAERVPTAAAVRLGIASSAVAMLVVATLVRTWWQLVATLLVAALATGLVHPAVNLVLARQVRAGLQGLLFGAKQSAVPAAALLAGAAVPAFAGAGWRWAFVTGALMAMVVVLTVPKWPNPPRRSSASRRARIPMVPVVLAGTGGAMASGAANAMAVFFVLSTTNVGVQLNTAAGLLVLGSCSGIVARVVAGLLAGRSDVSPFLYVGMLVGVGSLGFAILSSATTVPMIACGVVFAFAAGWGWPGVMLLGAVRISPEAPATSSGIVQGATFFGAVIGPALFGALAAGVSYSAAWMSMAVMGASGSVLAVLAGLSVQRATGRSTVVSGAPRER